MSTTAVEKKDEGEDESARNAEGIEQRIEDVHGLKEARHEVERQACAGNGCEREDVCVEQTSFAVEALA